MKVLSKIAKIIIKTVIIMVMAVPALISIFMFIAGSIKFERRKKHN